ncbi:Multidrug resistance efflux pump [Lysobacter dokdonensis DS-58]|uniref:Multidrug resistance efflux pump n=1 Tax=Lysobacter dokdonensis DS-58 TaxID=1300345 RepID=A0A0A2WP39_9GAMM|nr:HlyD family secretion protein [Lysobacter dokdonensis]KGQ20045.1 Multidrug resistance efflux pump [Lysobacter dokdonensis DS-58]
MEIILLLIYAGICWLIFFKFKLLPWNFVSQIIVFTLPIFGLTALILYLNVVAPSSSDVRVINYVVQVTPRVTGRVIEVPIEPNRPIKKGQVLFRIDPLPFQQKLGELQAKLPEFSAKLDSASAYQRELDEQLRAARSTREALNAKLALALRREGQTRDLSTTGAGTKFDYEQAQTDVRSLRADLAQTTANVAQVQQKLSARNKQGELSEVAQARAAVEQLKAQIAYAKWELDQTVFYAPADGTVVNLQLREGSFAAQLPLVPVMSFVENEQMVLAMFSQNELRNIRPGDEAEIALKAFPNRIIKTTVDSIVWSSGTGQLPLSGTVPQTGTNPIPPGRFAVRLRPSGRDEKAFLPMGAQGVGAVYTQHGAIVHIIRKVILRVGTKIDMLVLKLH